jgi:hypothetical protein
MSFPGPPEPGSTLPQDALGSGGDSGYVGGPQQGGDAKTTLW